MNAKIVTIELTAQQLTDIRVSVICRLDLLSGGTQDPAAIARYDRIRSLMADGGVLHRAMLDLHTSSVKEVL